MTLPITPATCHNAPVQKCMVLENTFGKAVATPTDKRGFVTPKFCGLVRLRRPMVSDGMGLPARMAARLNPCLQHPVHLLRVKAQMVASLSRSGAKTMKAIPRATAHHGLDTIRLHLQAINGLRTALHQLNHGALDPQGLHRAIGKATRGVTAIKRMAQTTVEG